MKTCIVCGAEVVGRSDKKYCSLQCKSADQYNRRLAEDKFYLEVDKQLKTNRKILKKYNQSGYSTVRKEVLLNEGFVPKYFTHYWKNNKDQVYLFCYEYGFLEIEQKDKKKYVIVEWQRYMT